MAATAASPGCVEGRFKRRKRESAAEAGVFSETEIDVAWQLVQLSCSSEEDKSGRGGDDGVEASSVIMVAFSSDRTNDSDGELTRKKRRYRSVESLYESAGCPYMDHLLASCVNGNE